MATVSNAGHENGRKAVSSDANHEESHGLDYGGHDHGSGDYDSDDHDHVHDYYHDHARDDSDYSPNDA